MKTFKITFKHITENLYEAEIKAESKEKALEIFEDDPFGYTTEEPVDEQGIDIEIEECIEI